MSDPDLSRFDRDPDALAWARGRVQFYIDKARRFEQQAKARPDPDLASSWRRLANYLDMSLIGNRNCVIAAFDVRRPQMAAVLDNATRVGVNPVAPVDDVEDPAAEGKDSSP